MRREIDEQELSILQVLDKIVWCESVRPTIDSVILRVERRLIQDLRASLVWEPVPLAIHGMKLPTVIHSSWVFVLRAQANTGAERHPNSQQRMMSYRGSGDLQIWTDGRWYSNLLASDSETPIENRWMSIPPGTWHQAIVPEENWVVLSFHTVPEDKLIEERPDKNNTGLMHQRRYLGN